MPDLDYLLFDSDNHYYEPRDAFTRCIESRHRAKHFYTYAGDFYAGESE